MSAGDRPTPPESALRPSSAPAPDGAADPASRQAQPAQRSEALPMPVFVDFLQRLHDGPPQHAAAVRVALAVWHGAAGRGDAAQALEALGMVRAEMDRLIASIATLQELGRRWSGCPSPSHGGLADARAAAEAWDRLTRRDG